MVFLCASLKSSIKVAFLLCLSFSSTSITQTTFGKGLLRPQSKQVHLGVLFLQVLSSPIDMVGRKRYFSAQRFYNWVCYCMRFKWHRLPGCWTCHQWSGKRLSCHDGEVTASWDFFETVLITMDSRCRTRAKLLTESECMLYSKDE